MQFLCWCSNLVLYGVLLAAASSGEEKLIGWKGETYKPKHIRRTQEEFMNYEERLPWVQTISWKPRAFVFHNFLSKVEMRHIIELASKQMKRSTVVGSNNSGVVDNYRTSYGTFLRRNEDKVISAVENRLALWSHMPASYQEEMQVLRYGVTNKYGPHIDGLERVASVLMYLVAPEEGGETAFTQSQGWSHPKLEEEAGPMSACAKGHVAYKPKPGDALMFFDVEPDYKKAERFSTHTGCPVIKGVKWNAVKWIHGKPFREDEYIKSLNATFPTLPDPGRCADEHENCEMWANSGECTKNPGYMTGQDSGNLGACRKACHYCESCPETDRDCYNRNRAKGGFLEFDRDEIKHLLD